MIERGKDSGFWKRAERFGGVFRNGPRLPSPAPKTKCLLICSDRPANPNALFSQPAAAAVSNESVLGLFHPPARRFPFDGVWCADQSRANIAPNPNKRAIARPRPPEPDDCAPIATADTNGAIRYRFVDPRDFHSMLCGEKRQITGLGLRESITGKGDCIPRLLRAARRRPWINDEQNAVFGTFPLENRKGKNISSTVF